MGDIRQFDSILFEQAVDWIALNDAPGDEDALKPGVISGTISVLLVADLFDKQPLAVAKEVVRMRRKFQKGT